MPSTKTVCCKTVCCLLLSFVLAGARGQVFTNDAGTREKHFVYEVKQIDEFFERFNNDTGSFIRKAYKMYRVKYSIDRTKLLKSLFNYETQSWDQALIDEFVKDVTSGQNRNRIDFRADGWYARANCKFQYSGAVIDIPIILKITTDNNRRSKWIIAAVKPNPIQSDPVLTPVKENPHPKKFINPASHANSFIELDKALNDKENLADYFDEAFFNSNNALAFYNAVAGNRVKFLYVKDIVYHFLQVGKWIFTVEYFQRSALNAGWLISSLRKVNAADKKIYQEQLLEQ